MKRIFTPVLIVLALIGLSEGSAAQGSTQTLSLTNLGSKEGKVYIGWYNSAASFGKPEKAVFKKVAEVTSGTVNVVFENVPPGTYAVAVFMDVNGNGKIDKNMLGIPKERYGFSNNVYPAMRAASFKEAAFTVGSNEQTISIRLK